VNFPRLRLGIGFAIVLGIATATAGLAQYTPITPGTPAPNITAAPTDTPLPAPSGGPRRGRRAPRPQSSGTPNPDASDTPEPPQFDTLDGIWEVEVQPLGKRLAKYTHLGITSTGADVSGYWEHDPHKTRSPLTGTFDGRLISLSVALPNGNTATFSGYVESFGDMVGLFRTSDADPGTAFTAEHRKKLKG
jgi:hypothetical protein